MRDRIVLKCVRRHELHSPPSPSAGPRVLEYYPINVEFTYRPTLLTDAAILVF